ncbi:thermonuclease family protein [Macrococcus epidermidis]|uniref:thermonuclease family protein n=1 Tax=Macrococcus epidermidis TaxID=1902580 RepID=UPI0010621A3E|nr:MULTISPECIES: thermonuclease family protein [Macrococcus]TDM39207.1 thermonuclease [Macrococcus goetzii]TDM40091.1 thermonuclease [Macrococcus goetzii]TDM45800.1 thermonuclease [Macrococcus goetzii]UTH16006.1 thermonuclease family protein [Macrococcus epidermidis]
MILSALALTVNFSMFQTDMPKINATFDRAIDGDTVSIKVNNRKKTVRLLLVDTPESKKPNTPVQPYAIEAARFTESLVKTCDLKIQYDTKGKRDRYGRDLVYLYCGNTMINELLVQQGYARVGYVYQQKDYLDRLLQAEKKAKQQGLKIWSIKGFVNTDGEGFNSTAEERKAETDIGLQIREALHRILDAAIDGLIKGIKEALG